MQKSLLALISVTLFSLCALAQTPSLDVPDSYNLGDITVNRDPYNFHFAVRGENLPEIVHISSDNKNLKPETAWVYGQNLEFGYYFGFYVSVLDIGDQSGYITFSGDGMEDYSVLITWTGQPLRPREEIETTETVQIGDLLYKLDSLNLTAVVAKQDGASLPDTIVIPDSVTYQSVTYPVTTLDFQAFAYCGDLKSVTLPASLKGIDAFAFSSCSGLTSIVIPDQVAYIGSNAFEYCENLASVTLGKGLKRIHLCAFYYAGLESLVIPDNVTDIDQYAFYCCNRMTSLTLGEGLSVISKYCFMGCSRLTTLTIPNSVWSIEDCAFTGLGMLTSLYISASVSDIQDMNFDGCERLRIIYNYAYDPQYLPTATFQDTNKDVCRLFVPKKAMKRYAKAKIWKDFLYLEPIPGSEFEAFDLPSTNDQSPMTNKRLRDGQVLIQKGNKTYTLTGQEIQ